MDDLISGYGIELRRLTRDKLEQVRQWRNHPDVARFMVNQEPISEEQQHRWFHSIAGAVDRAYYLICYKNQEFGVINILAKDGRPLEESRIIEPGMYLAYDSPYRGTILAFCPALAMNDYCFERLHCQQLVAKVKRDNRAALRFNQQLGYRTTSQDEHYVRLELGRADHVKARQALSRFIRFKQD